MKIIEKSPNTPEAIILMNELSKILESITGDNGKSSFNPNDVRNLKAVFVIAYNQNEEAIGCGAIRPIDDKIAEVKTEDGDVPVKKIKFSIKIVKEPETK